MILAACYIVGTLAFLVGAFFGYVMHAVGYRQGFSDGVHGGTASPPEAESSSSPSITKSYNAMN